MQQRLKLCWFHFTKSEECFFFLFIPYRISLNSDKAITNEKQCDMLASPGSSHRFSFVIYCCTSLHFLMAATSLHVSPLCKLAC